MPGVSGCLAFFLAAQNIAQLPGKPVQQAAVICNDLTPAPAGYCGKALQGGQDRKLCIATLNGCEFIDLKEIVWCNAQRRKGDFLGRF